MKLTMKFVQVVLASVLIIASISPVASGQAANLFVRVQPQLAGLANQSPQQVVSVIVQKQGPGQAVEAEVAQMGGQVTADLAIINAFSAKMSAAEAVELASNPGVRWVSLDAPVESAVCSQCVDTSALANAYISEIRADKVWNTSPYRQGQNIGIAIVDSGVNPNDDFYTIAGTNRQVANVRFNSDYNQSYFDNYGHGTHVGSIAGGNGRASGGKYIGVAPMVNIINVKVSSGDGSASIQNVVQGLQWVLNNKSAYNIRVVNLSLNSSVAETYDKSPLDAAVEILWFNGIVVVVSAGNKANTTIYPPANDPFAIVVGAVDDKGTSSISDDAVASFSASGKTDSGILKPDLVAPGVNIIAHIVDNTPTLIVAHPGNKVGSNYFRMSGTSMAAPMVSGVAALLLQDEPSLTPDQVKYRLIATANKSWSGYSAAKAGAGIVDAYAAVTGTTTQSSNTGQRASALLTSGSTPITWNNVGWNSVGWNSVGWNSVGWNSVGWNSVGWNSDYWGN